MNLINQIKQKLSKMDLDNSLILISVGAKNYNEAIVQLTKYLNTDKKLPGIYVTVNKPYSTIKRIFEDNGINTKTILFIDAITKSTIGKNEDCLFVGAPEDLTGISIAISEAVKSLPEKRKFLFFDSISTLSIHNTAGSVAKFTHFLTANMRQWGVVGVIILLKRETEQELIDKLYQFCDITIELGGEK